MHDAVKSLLVLVFILNHQSFWPALPCLLTLRQSFPLVIFWKSFLVRLFFLGLGSHNVSGSRPP